MRYVLTRTFAVAVSIAVQARGLSAQDSAVTLARARAAAHAASPDMAAARFALDAARSRARQAGAFVNPVLAYDREQTSLAGQTTSQDIIAIDQALELPGVRGARRDAARLRGSAAEARLRDVQAQVDFDVTRAYAHVVAADSRATLAAQTADAFAAAAVVSERRLREGDISGFAARRIRLEAARYAALRADAFLLRATARLTLAALMVAPVDSAARLGELTVDSTWALLLSRKDSLTAIAVRSRPDMAAAAFEESAAAADRRLAARERMPSATITLGTKREETLDGDQLSGFVAGVSLPLPLWDRRTGAVGAADAESRRRGSDLLALRLRVAQEVAAAVESARTVRDQLRLLDPVLQADAATALRSAQVAYTEGEVSLIEWLDTVRAYYEMEGTIANLRAELFVRAAALERAVGTPVIRGLR